MRWGWRRCHEPLDLLTVRPAHLGPLGPLDLLGTEASLPAMRLHAEEVVVKISVAPSRWICDVWMPDGTPLGDALGLVKV
jgi:hypothetical protein